MHLSDISFCDRAGYNVRDDESKQRILGELERLCGFKVIRRHFQKFHPATHVPQLVAAAAGREPPLATLRSNGNPYVLFMTRLPDTGVPTCFFVDKKVQQGYFLPRIILAKLWFNSRIFDGTAFHVEMIRNRDGVSWQMAVADVLAYKGQYVETQPMSRRLALMAEAFAPQNYMHDALLPFSVSLKQYVGLGELPQLLSADHLLNKVEHTCRGLCIKRTGREDILINFDDSLVVKNVRDKLRGNFIESSSSVVAPQQEDASIATTTTATTTTPATGPSSFLQCHAPTSSSAAQNATTLLWARKGRQPDMYELFTDAGCCTPAHPPVACVPTLGVSKMLAEAFRNKTLVDKMALECVMCDKFGKWKPLRLAQEDGQLSHNNKKPMLWADDVDGL